MKILSITAKNFGSYKELGYDFKDKGLTLISGPTGSGKSTFCDIIPWVLFGKTAKNGMADEILTWPGNFPTIAGILVNIAGYDHSIYRIRGSGGNDLYYTSRDGTLIRGKDATDTQKIINSLLGIDAEKYLSGAYYHEFSQTASFFTSPAKIRRSIIEQMVDLSLAVKLTDTASEYKKELKKEKEQEERVLTALKQDSSSTFKFLEKLENEYNTWDLEKLNKIKELQYKYDEFDQLLLKDVQEAEAKLNKAIEERENYINFLKTDLKPQFYFNEKKISLLKAIEACSDETCVACGNKKSNGNKLVLERDLYKLTATEQNNISTQMQLDKEISMHQQYRLNALASIEKLKAQPNTYLETLQSVKAEKNPFKKPLIETSEKLASLQLSTDIQETKYQASNMELSDTSLLLDLVPEFRKILVKNTIVELEMNTNRLLSDYFDGELRVEFQADDGDKIEVIILKDGNSCTYTQLSKGQRQLLKLCFGTSVMKLVSNHQGVRFSSIFLDEALDGLDDIFKVKAYTFLKSLELEYDNIFVVEHNSELKSLFENEIKVRLVDGASQIEET